MSSSLEDQLMMIQGGFIRGTQQVSLMLMKKKLSREGLNYSIEEIEKSLESLKSIRDSVNDKN